MRLYDLTAPDHRLIASRKFEAPRRSPRLEFDWRRRLAHKIADEIVPPVHRRGGSGRHEDRVRRRAGRREGDRRRRLRRGRHEPGDPERLDQPLARLEPRRAVDRVHVVHERLSRPLPPLPVRAATRPVQTLASFHGINSSPALESRTDASSRSRSRRTATPRSTCSRSRPGVLQRLTRHASIDTEPTWSPTGQQIAFVSDRPGQPRIFVMDRDGCERAPAHDGGFHTQPRWSPKGDTIVYTQREGDAQPLGDRPWRLQPAPADERSGRQSGRRRGRRTGAISRSNRIVRAAGRCSSCCSTDRRRHRSRPARRSPQVPHGRRACRDRIGAPNNGRRERRPKEASW